MVMNQKQYYIFISYSRKDYVRDDEIILGNPITAIQKLFDDNNISYWIDKEGIYSGQEFIEVISNAIANSKMIVFISSRNSNNSLWTAGEILEALDCNKMIIPIRIDDCPYNMKFILLIRPITPSTPAILRLVANSLTDVKFRQISKTIICS